MPKSKAQDEPGFRLDAIRRTNASMPLYAAVEKELLDRIATGVYGKGDLMPTEHELSEQLRVSRQTIREAIRRLAEAGLVSRHPGIGTRVNGSSADVRYTYPAGSLADIVEHVREVPLKVQRVDEIEARGQLAAFLNCRQGTSWLHVQGLRYHIGDEAPLAVSELFIRDKFPGLKERLYKLAGPVHMMLETHYGEIIEEVQQEIRSVPAADGVAQALGIDVGTAALEIGRRFLGKAGRLIVFGRAVYPADRFSYTVNFRREPDPAANRVPR